MEDKDQQESIIKSLLGYKVVAWVACGYIVILTLYSL